MTQPNPSELIEHDGKKDMATIEGVLLRKTEVQLTNTVNDAVSQFYRALGIMPSWAKLDHTGELRAILTKIANAHKDTIHKTNVHEFVSTYQNLLEQYPELQAHNEFSGGSRVMGMPAAWQAGYDWAYGRGEFAEMSALDAPEAAGYDLDDEKNSELWNAGALAARNEQMEDNPQ